MSESTRKSKIGFAGMSHLGIVSSICWASLGYDIVCVDGDEEKINKLSSRQIPIHEPGLDDLLCSHHKKILFTTDFSTLAQCNIVFISLDTETDADNQSNLEKLVLLAENVKPHLQQHTRLFLMSQVPLGFTRQLKEEIYSARPELAFNLYYWVETLVIGNAVQRFLQPERIIIGLDKDNKNSDKDLEFIRTAFPCPVIEMSYESAELTKASINLYLSTSVTFANVLSDLCEKSGASMNEIIPALRLDKRIGQYAYIKPGLGIAGGNLERDLVHLQGLGKKTGVETGLIDTIIVYNSQRYHWVHRQLERYVYPKFNSPIIAVWGLAYKKNTTSTKNSFAIRILHELLGKATLRAYDPMVSLPESLQDQVAFGERYEVLQDADCLVILTDWDDFLSTDYKIISERLRSKLIIDCVGIMDVEAAQQAGIKLIKMGDSHES